MTWARSAFRRWENYIYNRGNGNFNFNILGSPPRFLARFPAPRTPPHTACGTRISVPMRLSDADWCLLAIRITCPIHVFIFIFKDGSGFDRFGHPGETVIPGAGERWMHLHRGKSTKEGDDAALTEAPDDDAAELPWQVRLWAVDFVLCLCVPGRCAWTVRCDCGTVCCNCVPYARGGVAVCGRWTPTIMTHPSVRIERRAGLVGKGGGCCGLWCCGVVVLWCCGGVVVWWCGLWGSCP